LFLRLTSLIVTSALIDLPPQDASYIFANELTPIFFGSGQKFLFAFRNASTNALEISSSFEVGSFAVLANNTAADCVLRPHIPSAVPALQPTALSSF
jgi:hypothetical protein